MSRILITFGGAAYDVVTERTVAGCGQFGYDQVKVYDDRWILDSQFYELNQAWWKKPDTKYNYENRGFGWFIWKPYVIMDALEKAEEGDIVLYVDGDTYPIADLTPLYDRCEEEGVMLFKAQGCANQYWCKRDTFIVMAQDSAEYRFRQHAVARFMLFEKGPWRNQQFIIEWLAYCLNPLANTFDESEIFGPSEYPELTEPRCEQAILTNLAHKYGINLYREACQAGTPEVHKEDPFYPQLFIQDDSTTMGKDNLAGSRFRNVE